MRGMHAIVCFAYLVIFVFIFIFIFVIAIRNATKKAELEACAALADNFKSGQINKRNRKTLDIPTFSQNVKRLSPNC